MAWTHHVLPPTTAPTYGATFGTDPKQNAPATAKNGPARAALILILVQLLGSFGIAALAFAVGSQILQYLWLFGILSLLWFLMAVAAFVLAIVGMVIAVRRPTRKREAVFALVLTSIAMVWIVLRTVASVLPY
ncbi:alkaline shock response membrane anchor protein AmaP [Microbacterium sp. LWH7-1.2]|uniref:hypothetical protein n=1 Tax=Microbacterium sp. LWH7-1.2 TaxID=3135257 RepID=UPI003249DC57